MNPNFIVQYLALLFRPAHWFFAGFIALSLLGFTVILQDIHYFLGGERYAAGLFLFLSCSMFVGFLFWQVQGETLGSHFGWMLPRLLPLQNAVNISASILIPLVLVSAYRGFGGSVGFIPATALFAFTFTCNFANNAQKHADQSSPYLLTVSALWLAAMLGGIGYVESLLIRYPHTASFILILACAWHLRIATNRENLRSRHLKGMQGFNAIYQQAKKEGVTWWPEYSRQRIPMRQPGESRVAFLERCGWFERFGNSRFSYPARLWVWTIAAVLGGWVSALLWAKPGTVCRATVSGVIERQIWAGENGFMLAYLLLLLTVAVAISIVPRTQMGILYPVSSSEKHQLRRRAVLRIWILLHAIIAFVGMLVPGLYFGANPLVNHGYPSFTLLILVYSMGMTPWLQQLAFEHAEDWGLHDGFGPKTTYFACYFAFLILYCLSLTGLLLLFIQPQAQATIGWWCLLPALLAGIVGLHRIIRCDDK